MRLTSKIWACAVAAGVLAAGAAVRADDAPTTMLVIDGSGSMWGRLPPDGRAKIDIIRDKLGAVLQSSSPTRVGLVSFGHRRRGDCNDVEVMAQPSNDRAGVLAPLAKLNPRGPGPVTAAVKAAVEAIGGARPAQVIVVGDNADNCVPDTCAVAKDIAKTAPGVAVQIIGVGVPAVERPRLMCMAQETGGRYYDIMDSTGLNAAIEEATKLAILPPDSVAGSTPNGTTTTTPEGGTIHASAALIPNGATLTAPLHWRIFKSGEKTALKDGTGDSIAAKFDAGSYDVEASIGSVSGRQHVDLVDGAAENVTVSLGAAHLTVTAGSAAAGPPSPTAILTVTSSAGAPIALARGGSLDLYLAPADYTIVAADGAARSEKTVTLAAGDTTPVVIAVGTGRLELTSNGAANDGDVLYTIYEDDPDSPNGRRRVARSHAPQPNFTLPAGTYYVSARSGGADTQQRIAVGAGATVKQTITLTAATLQVSTLVAGSPATAEHGIVYRVDQLDGDHSRIARAIGPDMTLSLPAGRYQVTASLPKFRLTTSQEIAVTPGASAVAKLDIPSGTVTFKPPAGSAGSGTDVFWEVADVTGNPVWRAAGPEAQAILAPGHYTVRVDIRGQHKQAGFDVRTGEAQTVELGPG